MEYNRIAKRNARKKRKLQMVIFLFTAFFCTGMIWVGSCVMTANAGTEKLQSRYKYYTSIEIEKGDSLWSIAESYMSDEYDSVDDYIKEIKSINHISGDQIQQGGYLCIPYYSEISK